MANSYNTVTVQSSGATLILAANSWRRGLTIYNNGTPTVYVGSDASVTANNAIPVAAAANYDFNGFKVYKGAVYGIAASATSDVRYFEWTE